MRTFKYRQRNIVNNVSITFGCNKLLQQQLGKTSVEYSLSKSELIRQLIYAGYKAYNLDTKTEPTNVIALHLHSSNKVSLILDDGNHISLVKNGKALQKYKIIPVDDEDG